MYTALLSPALLDTIASPLFIVEGNSIRWTNVAAQRLLGYTSEALAHCTLSELIDPEYRPVVFAAYPKNDLVTVHNLEIRLLPSNSRPVWVDFSTAHFDTEDQDLWVITAYDITKHKLAAAATQERESVFRLAVDNFPGAFAIYDADLRFQYVNRYSTQVTGRPLEVYLGHTDEEFLPPSVTQTYLPTLQRALAMRTPQVIECKVDLEVGNIDLVVNYVPLLDEQGEVKQILGITHDITERKQMEEALRQSEEIYRSLVAALAEGIVQQSATGEIVACNASAERILGLTRDQMTGRTSLDPRWRAIHEDGSPFPGETHPAMVSLRTGQPCSKVVMGVHKPDGTLSWISINSEPMFHQGEEKPYAVIASFHDITERTEAAAQLRESEQRYRQLLDNAPVAISVFDLETLELLYANPASVALYRVSIPDPDAYARWTQSLSINHRAISKERLEKLRDGLMVPPMEYHSRLPDGRDLYTLVVAIPIMYQGRRAMLSINTDITDRKLAEQHALELIMERERRGVLEQLLQDTSHDLRTPLASLMTSSYIMKRLIDTLQDQVNALPDCAAVDTIRQTANGITKRIETHRHSIVRLKMLVEAMFDMIRLDARIDFEFLPYNLNDFIQPIINEQLLEANKRNLNFSFHSDENLPSVSLDGYEFSRVVQNLVENAIQYTPDGGQIAIKTYRQSEQVVLEVTDTGIGIDAGDLPHIFERFFRADRARSTRTGGNGLGLAIARKIVEAHRGRIEVNSALGQGSTFRVILPHS
jgi:PAS domain S-box-containing protein